MNMYGTHHKLIHIVAMDSAGVIGVNGGIPFRLKGDLARFKALTFDHPVIMGRKTYESLPTPGLKGRVNIILTRQSTIEIPTGAGQGESATLHVGPGQVASAHDETTERYYVATMEDALSLVPKAHDVYIIGGGEIYNMTLDAVHEVRATFAMKSVETKDTDEVVRYPIRRLDDGFVKGYEHAVYGADGSPTHVYQDWTRFRGGVK